MKHLAAFLIVGFAAVAVARQPALTFGLDLSSIDASVRPQDDLFHYVNGGWLARTEILRDWWKPQDAEPFQSAARTLVDQFGAYRPVPSMPINGELTLGENAGDLGGLSIVYRASKLSLAGRPAPIIDGFTGDQRFFMGWAQAWRGTLREDYLREWLDSIPYAPPEYRANVTVSNLPAFYEAFGVKSGDRLYRELQKRVRIW